MAVIETRAKVSILDGATSPLQRITNANDKLNASLARAGRAASGFSVNMGKLSNTQTVSGGQKMAANFDDAANSINNANKMLSRLTYSVARYTVIYEGISKLGDLWDDVVGGAYKYANMIETNRVGMAGILSSMLELNGKQMDWNTSMQVSSKIMKDLQDESLKTAATADELINTFRALLGPGLGAGMTLQEVEKLSVVGTNAVKSMGLPSNQIVQELRDLVQGGIRPASSTLATSLGITDSDIKAAKQSSEGLFKFLMDRMKGFKDSSKETAKTVEGRIAQIKEGLQRGVADGLQPLRGIYSETLEKITKELLAQDEATKALKINPDFTKAIENISDKIISIGEQGKNFYNLVSPLLKIFGGVGLSALNQVTNHLEEILILWGGFKISKFVRDIANMVVHTREEYQATTMIGKMIQGINDKIHHRAEREKEVLEAQQAQAEWQAKENELIDAATSAYEKMVGKISESAEKQKTLNGMVDSAANSVTRLAEKWQAMGMSASQSIHGQNLVTGLVNNGQYEKARELVEDYEAQAKAIQQQNEAMKAQEAQQKHQIELYNQQAQAIEKVVQAEHNRQRQLETAAKAGMEYIARAGDTVYGKNRSKSNVLNFLAAGVHNMENGEYPGSVKLNDKTYYRFQFEAVDQLVDKLQKLGYEEDVVYQIAEKFMNSLKKGMKGEVQPLMDQAIASAKLWQQTLTAARNGQNITPARMTYETFMAQTGSTLRTSNNYFGGKDLETRTQALQTNQEMAKQLLTSLEEEFSKVGMAADEAKEKAYEFTAQFVDGLKSINATNPVSVGNVFKQVSDSAQTYAEKFKLVQEETEAVAKANAEAALEFNALSNAFKVGGEDAYQAVRKVLEATDALAKALTERGATEQANAVLKERANYLQQVASAEDEAALAAEKEMKATKEATEALTAHNKAAKEGADVVTLVSRKYSGWAGKISIASMNLGIMTDLVAENTDGDNKMAEAVADVATQISMASMAIEGLISLFPDLIKGLKSAVTWFRNLSVVKAIASLPGPALVGMGLAAGAGAIIYGAGKKYGQVAQGNYSNLYSDVDAGMLSDDDESEDIPRSTSAASGPSKEQMKTADDFDMAQFGTRATSSNEDMYRELARVNEQKAKAAQDAIDRASLNPDITAAQKDGGSGGSSGGGSSRSQIPTIPMTPALKTMIALVESGMNPVVAAGATGNAGVESDYSPDAYNQKSGAYGLFQWLGNRKDNLDKFAEILQTNSNDFDTQIGFLHHELTEGEEAQNTYSLMNSNTPEEAAVAFARDIERPSQQELDSTLWTREQNARTVYDQYMAYKNGSVKIEGYSNRSDEMAAEIKRQQEFMKRYEDALQETTKAITDLTSETADTLGTQDAYDKTMAESNSKLAEYTKQIEKDKALGISTDALSDAMKQYAAAMREKAKEAGQTEAISKFNDELGMAQNTPLEFGEAEGRRDQITSMLEEHRAQLETWLQDTSLTYKQRIALEQELAQTIKSINDQSTYDYKQGWTLALEEISNEQVNWKDTWTSMLSGVESSMADALTTSGNFSTRMSKFFQGMAKSIVSSLAQVIARLLMVKAITGIFGGGSSLSVGNALIPKGVSAEAYLGYGPSAYASGGYAKAGEIAMVGEQGPELVRFGRGARVYNNADTQRMLSGGNTNVQVVVNNNTGTGMEARQSTTQDSSGKILHQIILTTVGDALSTNEYGLRDAIMGVQ